jgi:tetratricopeptide (TPR) repeat protein
VVPSLLGLGIALNSQGRYRAALAPLQEALEIALPAYGEQSPYVAICLNNLASSALEPLGNADEALADYRRALESTERAFGVDHVRAAPMLANLGHVLEALGDFHGSLQMSTRALAALEKTYGATHPILIRALTSQGRAYVGLHQASRAIAPLERALKLCRPPACAPMKSAEAQFALAEALWDEKADRARSRSFATQAAELYRSLPEDTEQRKRVERWLAQHSP